MLALVLTCIALSACSGGDIDDLIKAQKKTERLNEFGMNMSASVQVGNVTVSTQRQYICYGKGSDRRVYTKVDGSEAYYVGNLQYKYSGKWCSSCETVDDSEIYKKPLEAEKASDFEGAKVTRDTNDGNYVYRVTLTKEIILKQLEEAGAKLPSNVKIELKDEYTAIYTVDKKTGYLVEYEIPQCSVNYSGDGINATAFLKYKFSVVTDAKELKIDYPETFDEYVDFYSDGECFVGVEKYENPQAMLNEYGGESKYEKRYYFSSGISASDCDSRTGKVAVAYRGNETATQYCIDIFDKDMRKISTFNFYGTVQSLSIENDRLAVSLTKRQLGTDYNYINVIYVFDLTTNSSVYKALPDCRTSCKVLLYGDALAYYDGMSNNIYVYNFTSENTKVFAGVTSADHLSDVRKTADGKLSIVYSATVLDTTYKIIAEMDDNGSVSNSNKLIKPYSLLFNGTYWYAYGFEDYDKYVNAHEELSSLGVENFTGAELPENPAVIYYDGQFAIVRDEDYRLLVCDLKKKEFIYQCDYLSAGSYYKAGENCLYCYDTLFVYKLDLSAFASSAD